MSQVRVSQGSILGQPTNSFATEMSQAGGSDAPVSERREVSERGQMQQLVAKATKGCNASFGELTEHFYPRLVSFLYKRLGHLQDAEDVAADTLTRAWSQLHKFDARYQFSTWVYTIARRQAIDFHRRQARVPDHDKTPDVTSHLVAPQPRPADEGNLWGQASRLLSKEQYSALWLKYGEEMSVAEISKALGKSQVSIRVTLHRARKLLAKRLDKEQ